MANILLQVLCSFLFAVGLLFILLELRTRFDRSFRFFGISLIMLCAMTSIDIWAMPGADNIQEKVYWQRTYHAIACVFIPFSLWYLCLLTNFSTYLKIMPMLVAFSALIAGTFMTGAMIGEANGNLVTTFAYNLVFLPILAWYIVSALYVIIRRLGSRSPMEKRILKFHLVGFGILFCTGLLDLFALVGLIGQYVASYTVIGVMAFGIIASLIFAEHFIALLAEKQSTFGKLESAYKDLERVNALKQLGESTAIINHEIKNYMFMISGNAQILEEMETLSEKGHTIVKNIITSVDRLSAFSHDILNLSRTQIIKEKHPVNLSELMKSVIDRHYPSVVHSFTLHGRRKLHLRGLGQTGAGIRESFQKFPGSRCQGNPGKNHLQSKPHSTKR